MKPKIYSINIELDGEMVTIAFRSLRTGLLIAKALRDAYPNAEAREADEEHSRYMQLMSSYML